ncbi:hypothetical protein NM688_g862 [Phlebia brevispora]|uniref:Uncharacterized protein n=1 Tax=Phlebia brevispora TaxID=194682 RepID=A0ACC1TD01_9APHY|nr:hypothetical protein NM688_g862 [Phlebia brevispora]
MAQGPPEATSHTHDSTDETDSTFARFRRTVNEVSTNAKNYLGQLGSGSSSPQPSTSKVDDTTVASRPQTPKVEGGPRKPTAYERFINIGRVRKDWEIEWPPRHWISDTEQSDIPASRAEAPQTSVALVDDDNVATPNGSAVDASKAEPASPALVTDPEMVSYLSSPAVMNGSPSKGSQSVWSALDRLRAVFPGQSKNFRPSESLDNDHREDMQEDDESGVMVYAPLIPTDDSEVELAQSEVVAEPEAASDIQSAAGQTQSGAPPTSRVHFHPVRSKKIWVPSRDKISVQVMWWGYRIYLPPPVLEILDNQQIEGAKRAALLTAALKWVLDRVPMAILPPQARPAMKLFKKFAPYLGYVGSFVAWSWGSIRGFDKGQYSRNGVTLTATWLLTIAVIPGTWEEKDFPLPEKTNEAKLPPAETPRG